MAKYKILNFHNTRIATIDICEIGKKKHHVTGLIELDVSKSRDTIKKYNNETNNKISFTAWLILIISQTIKQHENSASFLKGNNKLMIFDDINVSVMVEKELNGQKIPIPLIIEKANESSIASITMQISNAKNSILSKDDIVLQKRTNNLEKLYYLLPGFIRRYFWSYILRHPKIAFQKMGNVAFTSIGMVGSVKGWFIPISIHPICFGVSSIIKKPVVIDDKIEIRETLNMSILLDHDVIDGAQMVRLINDLTVNIERGIVL